MYAWLTLQGYSYVPPHDDEALMEAVYSRGTIAISLMHPNLPSGSTPQVGAPPAAID